MLWKTEKIIIKKNNMKVTAILEKNQYIYKSISSSTSKDKSHFLMRGIQKIENWSILMKK